MIMQIKYRLIGGMGERRKGALEPWNAGFSGAPKCIDS